MHVANNLLTPGRTRAKEMWRAKITLPHAHDALSLRFEVLSSTVQIATLPVSSSLILPPAVLFSISPFWWRDFMGSGLGVQKTKTPQKKKHSKATIAKTLPWFGVHGSWCSMVFTISPLHNRCEFNQRKVSPCITCAAMKNAPINSREHGKRQRQNSNMHSNKALPAKRGAIVAPHRAAVSDSSKDCIWSYWMQLFVVGSWNRNRPA